MILKKQFKNSRQSLFLSCLMMSLALSFSLSANDKDETAIKGSIKVAKHTKDLAALAKISVEEADKTALTKAAGKITSSKLESENGFLVYAINIAGADHKKHEVLIDAGNGSFLAANIESGKHKEEGDDEKNEKEDD